MQIRQATAGDIGRLTRMRWDFTLEDKPEGNYDYETFEVECRGFLEQALGGGRWHIWVAEQEGLIVSHMYIELVDKVPRPGRITHPFAYMTNVYTDPRFRAQGIGGRLLARIREWAQNEQFEFIIVWPSEGGKAFYGKHGYRVCDDPMELHLPME